MLLIYQYLFFHVRTRIYFMCLAMWLSKNNMVNHQHEIQLDMLYLLVLGTRLGTLVMGVGIEYNMLYKRHMTKYRPSKHNGRGCTTLPATPAFIFFVLLLLYFIFVFGLVLFIIYFFIIHSPGYMFHIWTYEKYEDCSAWPWRIKTLMDTHSLIITYSYGEK